MATAAVCSPINDFDFARALARQEQEREDAALARSLAAGAGGVDQGLSHMLDPATEHAVSFNSDMLYVACEIAESEVDMLVDTGAQMSVISEHTAGHLGLLSHLDRSQKGVATGVGKANILGRLWAIPVKLGHVEFELNFSVLSMDQPLIILGLDQMRRFKCQVNMEKDCLVFGGSGGVEVPFLSGGRRNFSPIPAVFMQSRRAISMLQARTPQTAGTTTATLARLLRNVAADPEDLRYRRLHGSNPRLQREVLAHPEAMELLRIVGFINEGEDLVLPMATPLTALRMLSGNGGPLG